MKLLDKIALNRLIKIIMDFILSVLKIFAPRDGNVVPDVQKKKRPILDAIRRVIKNES